MGESNLFNNPFAALTLERINNADEALSQKRDIPDTPPKALADTDIGDAHLFLEAVQRTVDKKKCRKNYGTSFHLEEQPSFRDLLRRQEKVGRAESRAKKTFLSPRPVTANFEQYFSDAIRDEEQEPLDDAFTRAMRDIKPLSGKGREVTPFAPLISTSVVAETTMQDLLESKLDFALSMTGEYMEGHVVGLDEITMNKLRAGQYSPEAHRDLHGLNAMQAFHALVGFFRGSWYKGMRTVLIVPGRGRNSVDGIGVLREKLQSWLTQEPFKRVVLAFCTARPADGGPGSIYVLLRKMRKKGKICWERMPADPDLF